VFEPYFDGILILLQRGRVFNKQKGTVVEKRLVIICYILLWGGYVSVLLIRIVFQNILYCIFDQRVENVICLLNL
jgi:hypothetical protein